MRRPTFVVIDHRGEEIGTFRYNRHSDAEEHAGDLRSLGHTTAEVSDEAPTMPRRNNRRAEP